MANRLKTEFLLGIGVGCIISAFLVSLFGMGTMSDQDIMARAAKLGMVQQQTAQQQNPEQSQPSEQQPIEQQPSEQSQPSEKSTGGQAEKQDTVPQSKDSTQSAPAEAQAGPAEAQAGPAETAVIKISDRMGSETIARILEENGVIEDQYEFLKVVTKHDAHRRLQTGTFSVPIGGDLEEIIYILLGKKR